MRLALILLVLFVLGDMAWTLWTVRRIEAAHPPRGAFVQIEGGRIHVVQRDPQGPARGDIVLIHGASGNQGDVMQALGDHLAARGFRIFAPDRPGHGYSDRFTVSSSTARQATLVRAALEAMEVRSPVVVGHSWAGSLAENFVLDHADFAAGAVLVSPVTHPWPGGISWYYHAASFPVLGAAFAAVALPIGIAGFDAVLAKVFAPQSPPPDYIKRTDAHLVLRPSEFVANAADVAGLKAFVTQQAAREATIARPVAIVAGDADDVVTTSIHSVASAKAIPGASLTILPGIGHAPHWADPDAVIAAVEDVFARVQTPRETRPDTSAKAPSTSSQ